MNNFNEFKVGNLVKCKTKDYGIAFMIIYRITNKYYHGMLLDKYSVINMGKVEKQHTKLCKHVFASPELIRDYLLSDISKETLLKDCECWAQLKLSHPYKLNFEDFLKILNKIDSDKEIDEFLERQDFLDGYTNKHLSIDVDFGHEEIVGKIDGYRFIPSDRNLIYYELEKLKNCVFRFTEEQELGNDLENYIYKEDLEFDFKEKIKAQKKRLNQYINTQKKDVRDRYFPDFFKQYYIDTMMYNYNLDIASNNEIELFIKYTEELCEKNNKIGLQVMAYSCYGGNKAFDCDWKMSEDCLLKLLDIEGNLEYANTLGYIYYYGRVNDNKPEYEKAFKYFSMAAADGYYESQYKIADMFVHGRVVPKNKEVAKNILRRLYDENLKKFIEGDFTCKFGDVALRLSKLYCGIEDELNYLLKARFALKARVKIENFYGDKSVLKSIEKQINKTKYHIDCKPNKNSYEVNDFEQLGIKVSDNKDIAASVELTSNNKYKISLKYRSKARKKDNKKQRFFVTIPEALFCGFLDEIVLEIKKQDIKFNEQKIKIQDKFEFMFNGHTAFSFPELLYDEEFICEFYDCPKILIPKSKKHKFAAVVFEEPGQAYDYLCDIDVKIGDRVEVPSQDSNKTATVINLYKMDESETALPFSTYKKIIRVV